MKWTPWFMGVRYAYRFGGGGAYCELTRFGYVEHRLADVDPEHTVFLQGEEASQLVDALEAVNDASAWAIMSRCDLLIDPYFTD